MAYIVQNMTLIPQALNKSCWYASAQMVIRWKQGQKKQSLMGLIPPELDARWTAARMRSRTICATSARSGTASYG